jgi:hypothetical protein
MRSPKVSVSNGNNYPESDNHSIALVLVVLKLMNNHIVKLITFDLTRFIGE